jgi:uncharacterized protein (TIGR04255 family)
MTIAHFGLFYQTIRDEFPRVQTQPRLAPYPQQFGPEAMSIQTMLNNVFQAQSLQLALPRAWFVSSDDTLLLQIQPDRFVFNWRKGQSEADYPHFGAVSERFIKLFKRFESFLLEQSLGEIIPTHGDMIYVNTWSPPTGEPLGPPSPFLRNWNPDVGAEWPVPLRDLSFNARYVMEGEGAVSDGMLSAVLSALPRPTGEQYYQLELTALGHPTTPDLDGILRFHRLAHDNIVRCFTGLTTPSQHEIWERYQ